MWLFTRIGFFSATCARKDARNYSSPVTPHRVMVRVRDVEHLKNLQAFIAAKKDALSPETVEAFMDAKIKVTRNTDYIARVFVPKTAWAEVLHELTLDTDYDNFKNSVMRKMGACDYEHALHQVWSTMYRVQEKAHGNGIYSRPSRTVSEAQDAYMDGGDADTWLGDQDEDSVDDGELALEEDPDADEPCWLIIDKESDNPIGVITRIHERVDIEDAYEDAVAAGTFPAIEDWRHEEVQWGDLEIGILPVV